MRGHVTSLRFLLSKGEIANVRMVGTTGSILIKVGYPKKVTYFHCFIRKGGAMDISEI